MTLPDANNTSTPRRRVMVKARVVAVVSAVVLSLAVLGTQLSPAQADAVRDRLRRFLAEQVKARKKT